MEAEGKNRKRKLELNWNELLLEKQGDDEPPPRLVVITTEPQPLPKKSDAMVCGDDPSKQEYYDLTDRDLEEKIQRQQGNLDRLGSRLKDNGKKLRDTLEVLEEEKRRRTLLREKMVCSLNNLVTETKWRPMKL